MSAPFYIGQRLKGKLNWYNITKHLKIVFGWQGVRIEARELTTCTNSERSQTGQSVVIKSDRHFRLENERDVLKQFQGRSPFIRPLIDEIIEPQDPPAIVVKFLDDHLLNATTSKHLSKHEIKYVARRVLQALSVLHRDGFVHTG